MKLANQKQQWLVSLMRSTLLSGLFAIFSSFAFGVERPEVITLLDGSELKGVTEVTSDGDKLRIVHAGGVSRHLPQDLSPESQVELGLPGGNAEKAEVIRLERIETTEGKVYEQVRSVRVKPSHISFVHRDGASAVKFDSLSEEIRKKCGYDPAVAAEYERLRAEQEAMIAKAELLIARMKQIRRERAEAANRRQRALWAMEFTTYGSNRYWASDIRTRQLQDAMAARHFQNSGYTPEEAMMLMNYYRFR